MTRRHFRIALLVCVAAQFGLGTICVVHRGKPIPEAVLWANLAFAGAATFCALTLDGCWKDWEEGK